MCGILGAFGNHFSMKDVEVGLDAISHRGPDEQWVEKSGPLFWGMARLSIRDLQPKLYPFRFSHYKLIFNGELYNLDRLTKLVSSLGYNCKTSCDAEVILPLYSHFGSKAFKMLRGMFSLAIFDEKAGSVTIARDSFGEKPLYFYHNNKNFFFASELTALPKKLRKVSVESIRQFTCFGFLPMEETSFQNILKVRPGEYITFNTTTGKIKKEKYYSLLSESQLVSKTNTRLTSNQLDAVLNKIVAEKMVADVPVGLFLSGGLDSSLLAAIAQKHHHEPLHSFSVGFAESSVDESAYSKTVAAFLKTNHHHTTLSSKKAKSVWDKTFLDIDEPICDPACLPTAVLAEEAASKVKVVLTGEGADEFFSGYSRYQSEYLVSVFAKVSSVVPEAVALNLGSRLLWRITTQLDKHYQSVTYMSSWYGEKEKREYFAKSIQKVWADFFNSSKIEKLNPTAQMQLYDLYYYVAEQLCMKNDKIIMKSSLESRAPYLDTRLLPWLLASANESEQRSVPKVLLREVAQKYLPSQIFTRVKHGFSLPLSAWMDKDFLEDYSELFSPHPILIEAIGNESIDLLLSKYSLGKKSLALSVWNLMTINSWLLRNAK